MQRREEIDSKEEIGQALRQIAEIRCGAPDDVKHTKMAVYHAPTTATCLRCVY
jgi:hypothetical protein